MQLILYSTSACHLCGQALALLQPQLAAGHSVVEVDISESAALFARYGVRIPVLRREDTGAELNWPFTESEIGAWLAS